MPTPGGITPYRANLPLKRQPIGRFYLRRIGIVAIAVLLLLPAAAPSFAAKRPMTFSLNPVDPPAAKSAGPGDATVVAVVDWNFVPYHWDFLASKMPQHLDGDRQNDLPLNRPPHKWLPGFPSPKSFTRYDDLDLSLEQKDENAPLATLDAKDAKEWDKVRSSNAKKINYYWLPGTKVIGAIEFGGGKLHGVPDDHGMGTTSVSVGNIHGTCPECLLVFINIDSGNASAGFGTKAQALRWAMAQPWIDVVTNSYGHGVAKVYNGPGVKESKAASERGQSVVFSAGNGIENAFTVTNSTYHSSEKGPDWMLTVGAVNGGENNHYGHSALEPDNGSFIGHGKPVDVSGIGLDYPSAYEATTVSETGRSGFSGTSNAAPTIAGLYARALYMARQDLAGPSRVQRGGVIARGKPYNCGPARPGCELADGELTAEEVRARLLLGAVHTSAGTTTFVGGEVPPIGEEEFMNEGHGTYVAREAGPKSRAWLKEFDRIMAPMEGRAREAKRPPGERQWMIADSYCRQTLWGKWTDGYYRDGKTDLPDPAPSSPLRSLLQLTCPVMVTPPFP